MKPVGADFRPRALPGPVHWGLAGLLAMAAGLSLGWAWLQHTRLDALRQALAVAAAAQAAQAAHEAHEAARQPPAPATLPYDSSARELLRERSVPWPEALTALETISMSGVTPRSLEVNASDGTVRVELAAEGHARVLEYVEALNAGASGHAEALRWALQQSQADAAPNTISAVIVGSRALPAGNK